MNTKLTLTIESGVIEKAKEYAASRGRSLSDIIENYLKLVTGDAAGEEDVTPLVQSLKGAFRLPDDFNEKDELRDALSRKYL